MKRNICIIAPIPPPMTGNSKAVETIIKSDKYIEFFNFFPVNLSTSEKIKTGVFSATKVKMVINSLNALSKIQSNVSIDVYYLTIAQSTVGCLRDLLILHQIYKNKGNALVVLHLHGGGFQKFYLNSNSLLKKLIKIYYSKANTFIVLSNSLKSMFNNIVDESKIKVVENCVDNEFIFTQQLISRKLYEVVGKKEINIIYLSNMIISKGYLDLLYAAKITCKKNTNCKFMFAGYFQNQLEMDEFYSFIINNNLENCVEYLGVVEKSNKQRFLMKGDIFVLPTYYLPEGQPISILEAMAAGMPIITTKHGGIPDIITEDLNGIFVPLQSPESISKAIIELVNNRNKLVFMGENNRKKVMEKHLENHYINKMHKIFTDK